jgi:hypothetical protein
MQGYEATQAFYMHMLSGLIPLTRPNCSCCARTWTAATLPLVRHKFLAPWRAELRLKPVKLLLCRRVDNIWVAFAGLVWSKSDVVEEIWRKLHQDGPLHINALNRLSGASDQLLPVWGLQIPCEFVGFIQSHLSRLDI